MRRHRGCALRRRYGRAKSGLRVIYRAPTGLVVWAVPNTNLQIMWAGPGSRLKIGFDLTRAGGSASLIDHPSADGNYNTRREAEVAVHAFLRAK
jgi:hypothetical protein